MRRHGPARRALTALGLAFGLIGRMASAQDVPPPSAPRAPTTSSSAPSPAAPSSAAPSSSAAPAAPSSPAVAPAPAGSADAGAPSDPRVLAARVLEQRLLALADDRLDVTVDPRSLFDVDVDDPEVVDVEVRRLRAVVDGAPRPGAPPAAGEPPPPGDASDALYAARLAVDRARLAFLEKGEDERRTHLEVHAARRAAAEAEQPEVTAQREAQEKARRAAEEAAAERRRALEQMDAAQTEARRLVARERARLLGIREAQSTFEVTLHERDERRAARSEHVLALRRRVEELTTAEPRRPDVEASELYDAVRSELRAARGDLARALADAGRSAIDVPLPGPDHLGELAADRSEIERLRSELRTRADGLAAAARESRWAQVRHLHEVVTALNRDRHALYPYLPPSRRAALTGFGPAGREQASGEVDQLRLVGTYHLAAIPRMASAASALTAVRAALLSEVGLQLVALGALFLWWRRAARRTVERWADPSSVPATALGARLEPFRERLVAVATRVHRPLELLVFVWIVLWVAGPELEARLDVRLASTVARWLLGGLVVVHAVDGLLAPRRGDAEPAGEPRLRLRSLRLLGRLAVAVGLVLDLSAILVGRGTLYAWVLGTAWMALVPVAVVLVRWWRPTIERRCAARAKQSAVARWVVERASRPSRFVAAAVGGAYLLGVGVARLARSQMAAFDATRRVLAYLFRREVLRTARTADAEGGPLEPSIRGMFDPDVPPPEAVSGIGDAEHAAISDRIARAAGGVVAVVGERGSGKSTLVRRVVGEGGALVVSCPPGGAVAFRGHLLEALGLAADASDEAVVARLRGSDAGAALPAIVIDDAQRLVLPAVGGLDVLDRLLALARAASEHCTWIFCFGAVMWQFVERARGVRPLFDEVFRTRPWSEERIGELLRSRCAAAGIAPSFRGLADDDSAGGDERAELARRTESDYHRLLWDASGGNPAVALHFWREALRVAPDGAVVVSLFTAPDPRELQRLPAEMAFVLRAVLRLERVAPADVARSTLVPEAAVHEAIHFAERRGWVEERDGYYRVSWAWLRAITVFLQRRRLLVPRDAGEERA